MTEETARPLGEWLRQRREELGISLEQAEADTRIRARYLEALETEAFDALPDPIVGRGFLRNYSTYLELDVDEAAARYAQFNAPPPPEPLPARGDRPLLSEPFRPLPLHDMPGFRSSRGWIAGLAVVLLVVLALAAWWGAPRIVALWNRPRPTATQRIASTALPTSTLTPSVAVAETSTPTVTATEALTPEASAEAELTLTVTWTPSPSVTPSRPAYLGIFLELVFTDTSWVQVSVDGVRQFQGELEEGTYRSWYAEERLELRVGNAGAVLVTVNGQSLGTLGAVGEVVDRVFEKVGEGVTEATVTPIVSGTVTTAVTVEATATQPPPTNTPTATEGTAEATLSPVPEADTPTPGPSPSATVTPTVTATATAGP